MPRGIETCLWTARKIDDERFVGWFCLWPESEVYAELGYRLQRDTWGLGLATEGSQAIIDWAFESAGYERIAASTMAVNQASRKVMQKLGMRHVRTVPFVGTDVIAGSEEGEVWYEVSRQEWTENRG
jgi:RimJ/RimL family protein N-acetyltransferase